MQSVESDDQNSSDIILNGDENGQSSLIGEYKAPTKKGEPIDDYKYLGFVTLKDATADSKYLILTFDGNITQLRFEFANIVDGNMVSHTEPYWFNAEGQTYHFVTADESPIPLSGEKQTVVIDLEKSGISLADYNSFHMHCDLMATYGNFSIINARLSDKADVKESDKVAPPEPETTTVTPGETTTETPTEKVTEKETTAVEKTTTAKIKKPGKTKIKNVVHKKGSKRVKITLKKVKGATGYQIKVSTKKSFSKKTTVTAETKKLNKTIKKLKKAKKYYVKARAFVKVKNTQKYGKWTKVKTVK